MLTAPASPGEQPQQQPAARGIAPAWHTAGVCLLLLGVVLLSLFQRGGSHAAFSEHRLIGYTFTLVAEWIIVAFIWLGARWGGATLETLMGANLPAIRTIARDLGLAVAFLILANIILGITNFVLTRLMHPASSEALKNLLPRTQPEVAVFLLLALNAGICEEMIFRGYLQRQFTAWTRSAAVGIVAQAIGFGVAHAYQGSIQVIVISVYGCLFGLFALWRKSLRSGMMAHFLQDGIGGLLLARFALK
ncbi:MAG: CPBP family intramembrane glutamic endopeptidase [Terracidiphilus sp.]|jgi:membrane protease YdiL (CAAX protease family)